MLRIRLISGYGRAPTIHKMISSDPHPVLVLVSDLILSSRINATARAQGTPVIPLRDPKQLAAHEGKRLIVDLNQPGAIDAAVLWKQRNPEASVIGFVSHVDMETIAKARTEGIDHILPRSRFVAELEQLLRS